MKRITGLLLVVLTSFVLGSKSLTAGVIYTAGSADVAPGNFSVAITVSSDLAPPNNYWGSAGFNLVWDQDVLALQLSPVNLSGSPLPLSSDNFNSPLPGQLSFSWFSGQGYQVADGSTLFSVNFTAIGDVGDATTLSFANLANIGLTDVNGGNLTFITPTGVEGLIQVVPEPVEYALGLFAFIVLGTAGVRWVSNRRSCCTR